MVKCYVIKNKKSEYFMTNGYHFEELGNRTKFFKEYRDAYKELEIARNNQVWDLLEQIYNTDRFHIDVKLDEFENVAEHVDLIIKAVDISESSSLI